MYSLNEKSAQFPKPLKSLGSGRKPPNLELEDEMLCYLLADFCFVTNSWSLEYILLKNTL